MAEAVLAEEPPLGKKIAHGVGAFLFVFVAAMGGTAFMLSGGFDMPRLHDHGPGLVETATSPNAAPSWDFAQVDRSQTFAPPVANLAPSPVHEAAPMGSPPPLPPQPAPDLAAAPTDEPPATSLPKTNADQVEQQLENQIAGAPRAEDNAAPPGELSH